MNGTVESLLSQRLNRRRPLWQAIAHTMLATKAGEQDRLKLLNKLFLALPFPQQQQARMEMAECRAARRAGIMRGVA